MGFQSCGYNTQKIADTLGVSEQAVKNAMKQSLQGGFVRVWGYEIQTSRNGKEYAKVELSASRKSLNGTYETNFQSKAVSFVGQAGAKIRAMQIPESGVSIQITSCEVTNRYDRERQKEYTNYTVYDFEVPERNGNNKSGGYNNNRQSNQSNRQGGYQGNNRQSGGYNNYAPPAPPVQDEDEELPF